MKLKKIHHVGIPVADFDRAREFYTKILGMKSNERVGGNSKTSAAIEIHRKVARLDRLKRGYDYVVLFEQPQHFH